MDRLWTRPYLLMITGTFVLFTSFYMLYPTLPLFIKQLGGNDAHVGLAMGAFMLTSVVFRPIVGGLLDRFVPPEQVLQLWRHWEEPAIAWYAGAHLTFPRHPEIRRFVDQGLADSGVTAGPPR